MKTTPSKKTTTLLLTFSLCMPFIFKAHAQVGSLIQTTTLPVQAGLGVGIEADCDGNLYYTNYTGGDNHLYKIDKNGTLLNTVSMHDSTGAAVSIGAISWDNNRQMLWGGTQTTSGVYGIYMIEPGTGFAHHRFTATIAGGYAIDDGLAYDNTDSSIWIAPDVFHNVEHYKEDGTHLGTLTPAVSSGISGVLVGQGDMLYLGLDGQGTIVQVTKSTGSFISSFSSPGGRDEDLSCDNVNFLPYLVIWSRDAYNNTVDAIEVEPGTCKCSYFEGTQELFAAGISIFPNPATDYFTLVNSTVFRNAEIEVTNVLGTTVYSDKILSSTSYVVNKEFAAGIYFVKISDSGKSTIKKLIIR